MQPVAVQAGLPKIGWHSFRHMVSAWVKEAGLTLEEVKTLLRHENIATTSQVYGAQQMEAKRELQRRLVDFVKRSAEQERGTGRLGTGERSWDRVPNDDDFGFSKVFVLLFDPMEIGESR